MRSLITALLIAATVLLFSVRLLAPLLPPVVGPPDMRDARSLKFPDSNELRLHNADGAVHVRTHPDAAYAEIAIEVDIRAYFRSGQKVPDARAYVASLVEAHSSPELLDVVTEPSDRPMDMDIRVDYSIVVPQGTDIEVVGSNGNVWISKGCGRVTVRGGNTDIEIVEPAGPVIAQSTNGRIRVVDAAHDTVLETVNGNIYAHMRGGSLQATSANGHIVARVLERDVKAFDLTSQNGGITIVLRDDCSVVLEASTGRGIIRSDFPIDGKTGIQSRRHLRGSIGGGDTKLNAETLNGNIWVAKG